MQTAVYLMVAGDDSESHGRSLTTEIRSALPVLRSELETQAVTVAPPPSLAIGVGWATPTARTGLVAKHLFPPRPSGTQGTLRSSPDVTMDLELRAPVSGPSLTRLGTGDYIDAVGWDLFVNVSHGNYSGDERAPKLLARLARVYPREVDSSFRFRAAAEWGLIQEGVGVVSSGVVGRMWVAPFEWCVTASLRTARVSSGANGCVRLPPSQLRCLWWDRPALLCWPSVDWCLIAIG